MDTDDPNGDTVQSEEHGTEADLLAMRVAITDRVNSETTTMTAKRMDPTKINLIAIGQKKTFPNAMRRSMRTAKGMILKGVRINEEVMIKRTRGTKPLMTLLRLSVRTMDKT